MRYIRIGRGKLDLDPSESPVKRGATDPGSAPQHGITLSLSPDSSSCGI